MCGTKGIFNTPGFSHRVVDYVMRTELRGVRWKYYYYSAVKAWEKPRFDGRKWRSWSPRFAGGWRRRAEASQEDPDGAAQGHEAWADGAASESAPATNGNAPTSAPATSEKQDKHDKQDPEQPPPPPPPIKTRTNSSKKDKGPAGGFDETPIPRAPPGFTLKFTFHRATNLPLADINTLSADPFIVAELTTALPTRHKEDPPLLLRTPTIRQNTDPEWNTQWIVANPGVKEQAYSIKKRMGSKRAYLLRAIAVCFNKVEHMNGSTYMSFWIRHYSLLLGRLLGQKEPSSSKMRGPVPEAMYHRYVKFKPFIKFIFTAKGGGRIFIYILTLDALFRFIKTGKEFSINILLKYTMYSNVAIYIAFFSKFFTYLLDAISNRPPKDEPPKDLTYYKFIINNNLGTYRSNAKLLL
ncbi:hypothetical protein K458DRAFT_480723 [Lentithecium fluviatile CBS 122367]|uniref:C2 domain-containing protein n=1 Tax=Lentithecium fluviatile CBS 122367 TaxID=1168545 RepID=A0A6G1ILG9_9PLEO|nr:hypothetical protein K458DRAFT_480723 [Lentithecium fluviatile CBS 122367]